MSLQAHKNGNASRGERDRIHYCCCMMKAFQIWLSEQDNPTILVQKDLLKKCFKLIWKVKTKTILKLKTKTILKSNRFLQTKQTRQK